MSGRARGLKAAISKVVYQELNMGNFLRPEAGNIQNLNAALIGRFTAQQIVRTDGEKISKLFQHVYRGHNIVVFPIADALLLYADPFRKLRLGKSL